MNKDEINTTAFEARSLVFQALGVLSLTRIAYAFPEYQSSVFEIRDTLEMVINLIEEIQESTE